MFPFQGLHRYKGQEDWSHDVHICHGCGLGFTTRSTVAVVARTNASKQEGTTSVRTVARNLAKSKVSNVIEKMYKTILKPSPARFAGISVVKEKMCESTLQQFTSESVTAVTPTSANMRLRRRAP